MRFKVLLAGSVRGDLDEDEAFGGGGVLVRKIASPRRDLAEAGGCTAKFISHEHSFAFRFG